MAFRDIGKEMQDPNSLTAQQTLAALFFRLNLELIYEEEHAEFVRQFFKAEEDERANYAEAKNYFAWKEQQQSIRDAIESFRQERKTPEIRRRLEDKPEKDLQSYLAKIEAEIKSLESEIEKHHEELKDYEDINKTWNTKIDDVVAELRGPDGRPLTQAVQDAVRAELRAAPPIAMVLATVGESYQKDKEENSQKIQPEAKTFSAFAETVMAIKSIQALQKQLRKKLESDDNIKDFKDITDNNKFKTIKLNDQDKAKLENIFINGAKFKKTVLELGEKEKKLKELENDQKAINQWVKAMEADKPAKSEVHFYSQHSLFGEKPANKQPSNQGSLPPSDHPSKKQE